VKKIGGKLFAGFLCMTVISIGLLWLVQAVFMKDNYLNQRVQSINSYIDGMNKSGATDYKIIESVLNVSIMAVDTAGKAEYVSGNLPMKGLLQRKITELMEKNTDGQVQYLQEAPQETRYAEMTRKLDSGIYLFVVFSLVDVNEASRMLLQQLWIITAALLALSLILAVILSRMFSKPIVRVTNAAREMSEGKLDISLPVKSRDEIGQLTKALNELGAELKKTEDLRRELIANVSHELRSPLSVIQGFAETVRDVTWPDEKKRSFQLTIISEEAQRLSKIVSDILDYSRLQSGVESLCVEDFNVCTVLKEAVSRYEIEGNRKGLIIGLDCPDVKVRFDKGRFIQVVGNLLNNAVNHAFEHTEIHVSAENIDDAARITIENKGKPIPYDELDRIWDRYHRVPQTGDGRNTGTGLGLSIVKSILSQHGVSFGVSSDEKSTVFWFDTVPVKRV
jgi:signal transduction histidine kinase